MVRLVQGDYDRQITYGDDPVAVAEAFARAGAQWVHVVDLDAARTGTLANLDTVRDVLRSSSLKLEFGGGVRDDQAVDTLLDAGVARVVVGSAALKNWTWFEGLCGRENLDGRIALGLDAREGKVAIHGWTEQTDTTAVELARRVSGWPLGAIVFTDIAKDAMLSGPSVASTRDVVEATDVPVVASGGVTTLDDVRACLEIGCGGAIVGRAWYEGRFDLAAACEMLRDTCEKGA